ncbi:MAG: tetraacyldisaccharide 4'-kinase [Candidatus Omnitrophica bacterium]|nr:tetraacyldisaccharide 4'-kinase [Candidatus Omnitrophota bacterium]
MSQFMLSIMQGQRRDIIACLVIALLMPLTLLYALGVFCHRLFYRFKGVYKAPLPVISIGNITVGGTGKTPLVVWVAQVLKDKGLKSVVLTRGHMPQEGQLSDEALMMTEQLPDVPVLSGADRIKNIKNNSLSSNVYILDDGFQHWKIQRDLNILLINAANPFGNGHLLPAGILREGLGALKRADVIVLTKTDQAGDIKALYNKIHQINPSVLVIESCYQQPQIVDVFSRELVKKLPLTPSLKKEGGFIGKSSFSKIGRKGISYGTVLAFCAIADPASFEFQLRKVFIAHDIQIFNFMDHHVYTKEDVLKITESARDNNIATLVTTHKDAVKLYQFKDIFKGFRLVYISAPIEITKGSHEFVQKINSICSY